MIIPEVELTFDSEAQCFVAKILCLGIVSAGPTKQEARIAAFSAAALTFRFLVEQEEGILVCALQK